MLRVSIQNKILLGYLVLVAVIGSMTAILLHERKRTKEIEAEAAEVRKIRNGVSIIHSRIAELATHGESVIAGDRKDFEEYKSRRLVIDSLLQDMKQHVGSFVHAEQIDTLCGLLEEKEKHLLHIMEAVMAQEEADSLLTNRLPVVTERALRTRTVTRRKKGIAGWFGKKETVQVPSQDRDEELRALNGKLVAMQEDRERRIDTYTRSLRLQNKELNRKLYDFITALDGQAQEAFKSREEKISQAQDLSYHLFTIVTVAAIALLVVSFLIIRHDLKKEGKVKLQLRQIIRENEKLLDMRKKIILTVSHDIRGPLGNINNCAELASDTREKRKREAYLENIRHSCRHILHLVNDLMDVYKINEAKDTKNEVPFRLDELLARIAENHSRKAHGKALLFEAAHKCTAVTVKGDADKIEQVLDNLLTNAIKFTPSGSVRLLTEYSEGRLRAEVRDTGIGMDEQTLERIFHPFERAAQNVNSEGFGLGLFITKGLVKALSGNIEVESKPGQGSVFRLSFPLPETSEEVETEDRISQPPGVLPKKVLVVDDDSILLKIAEDMLGRNGVECTACLNAAEAVNALYKSDYDLVLTDMQMPGTDGFGLLKLLRSSDIGNSRTVPVAVMTARGDGGSGIYEQSGFCGCLHKPFPMKGLLAFISSVTADGPFRQTRFDYARLMENTDDRQHMFGLVVKESEKDFSELEDALPAADRAAMRKVVHRMMPVWELLGADGILSAYRKILHDRTADDETLREHTKKLMREIKELIEEAKTELNRDADGN